MALGEGTTAPEIMLFPYNREPATGSLMPSMSTAKTQSSVRKTGTGFGGTEDSDHLPGGAAIDAVMKQAVAARRVGT